MWKYRATLISDVLDLLYPVCCLVCGDRLREETYLCAYCMDHSFEPANPDGKEACDGMILPDWIRMQDAMWEFDKGGFLQDVLHHIKYGGLPELAVALGRRLGYRLKQNCWMDVGSDVVLLPVPLHPARLRKRGYNQSAMIARGINEITGSVVADHKAVVRVRNTRTQTGLNARVRRDNISGAFQLNSKELFRGSDVIIVDDVITTGATALELARLISDVAGCIAIATIARA